MQRRGIVMDHDGKHAIVLTPDQQFIKIKADRSMHVGSEVFWRDRGLSGRWSNPSFRRFGAVAASLLVVATVAGSWQLTHMGTAEAAVYVGVDINPSVEFGVDANNRVVSVRSLDSDGERLIKQLSLLGQTIASAVSAMTSTAAKDGYLKADMDVLVSVSPSSKNVPSAVVDETRVMAVHNAQRSLASTDISAQVIAMVASTDVWKKADSDGLSAGKYALWLQSQVDGDKLSQTEVKSETVTSLLHNHEHLKVVIQDAEHPTDVDAVYQRYMKAKNASDSKTKQADGSTYATKTGPQSDSPSSAHRAAEKEKGVRGHGNPGMDLKTQPKPEGSSDGDKKKGSQPDWSMKTKTHPSIDNEKDGKHSKGEHSDGKQSRSDGNQRQGNHSDGEQSQHSSHDNGSNHSGD